jgi:hypothetical protein
MSKGLRPDRAFQKKKEKKKKKKKKKKKISKSPHGLGRPGGQSTPS